MSNYAWQGPPFPMACRVPQRFSTGPPLIVCWRLFSSLKTAAIVSPGFEL